MEIKSIEKQGDIVTVKMTMPKCCGECAFFPDDSEEYDYCRLAYLMNENDGFDKCDYAIYFQKTIPEFCPLRCNNG